MPRPVVSNGGSPSLRSIQFHGLSPWIAGEPSVPKATILLSGLRGGSVIEATLGPTGDRGRGGDGCCLAGVGAWGAAYSIELRLRVIVEPIVRRELLYAVIAPR